MVTFQKMSINTMLTTQTNEMDRQALFQKSVSCLAAYTGSTLTLEVPDLKHTAYAATQHKQQATHRRLDS